MSAISRREPIRSTLAVLVIAVALAACTAHPKSDGEPSLSPSVPVLTSVASSPAPASSSAPAAAVLPAGCPELLPLGVVEQALGGPLFGQVSYLRAAPVPQSGRTGRVTCGYGTATEAPPVQTGSAEPKATPTATATTDPLVEASYITYVDAKTASSRVALTVQTDGATAKVSKIDVSGLPASVLLGQQWNELVMSDGARTIVVEASPSVLPAASAPAALAAMAKVMLAFGAPAAAGSGSAAASSSAPVSG